MSTENKIENENSFTCYNCNELNFYNIEDYIDNQKGRQLLMEMQLKKTKDVSIFCKNPKCRCENIITITYF